MYVCVCESAFEKSLIYICSISFVTRIVQVTRSVITRTNSDYCVSQAPSYRYGFIVFPQIARFMGPTWAHLGPTGPMWVPCWPHEFCYLGRLGLCWCRFFHQYRLGLLHCQCTITPLPQYPWRSHEELSHKINKSHKIYSQLREIKGVAPNRRQLKLKWKPMLKFIPFIIYFISYIFIHSQ